MIKIQKIIPQMTVHAAYGEEIWATKKYTLYKSGLKFEKFNIVAQLPVSPWLRMAARSRSISRFFRLGVRSMKKLASGTILIIADRKIFRLTDDDIQVVYSFRFGQGPLRDGWCFDPEGNCYFGEYFLNKNRKYPIHFYHSDDDGQTWNQVSAFNDIRHIHCVYHDPYSGQIWMSTGDRDRESKIMFTENGGTTWTPVGSGNQKFRAVSLIFTRDSIYWGSDSPTRQNYIFRYIRRTGEVESLAPSMDRSIVLSRPGTAFSSLEPLLREIVKGRVLHGTTKPTYWDPRMGMNGKT